MITNLKIVIDRSGYKQKHLANAIGVDYTLFSKYVAGDRPLPNDAAKKLAKILKVKEDSFNDTEK
jgi:transcriptional regulator with XRE-family HTH domain